MGRRGSGEPVEAALRRMAIRFANFRLGGRPGDVPRLYREGGRVPRAPPRSHASGPARARAQLIEFFAAAGARGELRIDDPETAADQFAALCKSGSFLRALLGAACPSEAEIARNADEAGAHLPRPLRRAPPPDRPASANLRCGAVQSISRRRRPRARSRPTLRPDGLDSAVPARRGSLASRSKSRRVPTTPDPVLAASAIRAVAHHVIADDDGAPRDPSAQPR